MVKFSVYLNKHVFVMNWKSSNANEIEMYNCVFRVRVRKTLFVSVSNSVYKMFAVSYTVSKSVLCFCRLRLLNNSVTLDYTLSPNRHSYLTCVYVCVLGGGGLYFVIVFIYCNIFIAQVATS